MVPDPSDKNIGAADRLLEAVACLLAERGAALVAGALKPEDVTARAGKSRASYYRTDGFPGADAGAGDESRLAVLEASLRRSLHLSASDLGQITGAIDDFVKIGWRELTIAEFVLDAAMANFDVTAGYDLIEQLYAAALCTSNDAIAADLAGYYDHVTEVYAAAYTQLVDFLGYRMRPPFTTEHMAIGLMALAEGLAMRALADDTVDRELFGQLLALFATSIVLAPGETIDPLDPRYRPLPSAGAPPRRSEIISQLLKICSLDRETMPTIDELADHAGCSASAISTSFGSIAGVVRAAWDEWVPEFADAVSRDRQTLRESDSLTLLYRCMTLVAIRAAEHRAMTRALLMADLGTTDPSRLAPDPVISIFEHLLVEAAGAGDFTAPGAAGSGIDPAGITLFSRSLRTTLLQVVATSPIPEGTTPAQHGRWCADYTWSLMMPARRRTSDPSTT